MLRLEMSEMPMAMTRAARQVLGMEAMRMGNWVSRKIPRRQKMPAKMEAKRVRALEAELRAERVSEPEAGMPEKTPVARFAMPTENMSWLMSGRSPVREARDFDMTVFSNEARKAMAKATAVSKEICSKRSDSGLEQGSRGRRSESEKGANMAMSPKPRLGANLMRAAQITERATRVMAKFGRRRNFRWRKK